MLIRMVGVTSGGSPGIGISDNGADSSQQASDSFGFPDDWSWEERGMGGQALGLPSLLRRCLLGQNACRNGVRFVRDD